MSAGVVGLILLIACVGVVLMLSFCLVVLLFGTEVFEHAIDYFQNHFRH